MDLKLNLNDENIKIIEDYRRLVSENPLYSIIYDAKEEEERDKRTEDYFAGLEEGKKSIKLEIMTKLLNLGAYTIEQIAEIVNLPIAKIKREDKYKRTNDYYEGIEKSKTTEKLEIAEKLLKLGINTKEQISGLTSLTISEIEDIQKEILRNQEFANKFQ